MIIICSWCSARIGWVNYSKGESHGICLNCLQEFFPIEAKSIIRKMRTDALATRIGKQGNCNNDGCPVPA
jgi:hypothetical protein